MLRVLAPKAEPKRWISVTATPWSASPVSPMPSSRWPVTTRSTTCSTGVTNSDCAASSNRNRCTKCWRGDSRHACPGLQGPDHAAIHTGTLAKRIDVHADSGRGKGNQTAHGQGKDSRGRRTVNGGWVNFDTHGDDGGRSISYEKGRNVSSGDGSLVAEFTGNHGWYRRNRGQLDRNSCSEHAASTPTSSRFNDLMCGVLS